jgi:hypothetical protein
VAVVGADDRGLGTGDQALLHVGIVLHGTVTIEMIGRQVEQDAGGGIERRGKIDLIGRAFDDEEAAIPGRIERQHGTADIAAKLPVAATGL